MVSPIGQAVGNGTPNPLTIAYNSTAGNTLILCVSWLRGSSTVLTITDSAGNTWLKASEGAKSGSNGTRTEIWYVIGAAAITSVSISNSSTASLKAANVSEWPATVTTLDKGDTNTVGGSNTAPTSDIITPTAGDLIIASMNAATTSAVTVGTANGYIALASNNGGSGGLCFPAYKASGASSEQETWALGSSAVWGATIAAFSVSGGTTIVNTTGSAAASSSGSEGPTNVGVIASQADAVAQASETPSQAIIYGSQADATSSGSGTLSIAPTFITGEADANASALINHGRIYITAPSNASSSASAVGTSVRVTANGNALTTGRVAQVSIYSFTESSATSSAISTNIILIAAQGDAITGGLAYTLTRIVVESDAITSGSALPTVSGLLQVTGIANATATADVALAQQISEAFAAATSHAVAMTTVFGNTKYNPQRRS